MYLKKISLYNFRKFSGLNEIEPGITVHLNSNFNVLVGENDSGKTAIIDAIRLLLGNISEDFEKISEEDFHSYQRDHYSDSFCIEGYFSDLSEKEAGAFLEWLSFDEQNEYELRIVLKVEKRQNENGNEFIDRKLLAGGVDFESRFINEARNLLKTTYLKPLRDASSELKPGFKSRLVHILKAHPVFKKEEDENHKLVEVMQGANDKIEEFFEEEYIQGRSLLDDIQGLLSDFYDETDQSKSRANFTVSKTDLSSILRKLSLDSEDINLGLGNLNLLFIATEMLLVNNYLSNEESIGPNITLIEEIEAHLHTQAQIRLIKFLEKELDKSKNQSQFILTSHSPNLASSIDPKYITLLHQNQAFPLKEEYTRLDNIDYMFLERFLDSTKSNLFFAKGVIFVEGESEMLLVPALANLLGYPLYKNGISLVNVHGTSFERYIKLFSRSSLWKEEMSLSSINMPISIITDLDVKPLQYYEEEQENKIMFNIMDEDELSLVLDLIEESREDLNLDYLGVNYLSLKALARDFEFDITSVDENVLNDILEKKISASYIKEIEDTKREKLIKRYRKDYDCNLNICIAPKWTLEYSLAQSCLAKSLYRCIHETRYKIKPMEGKNKEKYKKNIKELKEIGFGTEEVAYKIFKPLNEKVVSKAEVAQKMAIAINKVMEIDPESASKWKDRIMQDDHLKYLVDAVKHCSTHYSKEKDEEDVAFE